MNTETAVKTVTPFVKVFRPVAETSGPNRQQRRALKRRQRGRGLTRQYASKRARDRYGAAQRPARGMSQADFMRLFKEFQEQQALTSAEVSADETPTEEYEDLVASATVEEGALVEDSETTFDLMPDVESPVSFQDEFLIYEPSVAEALTVINSEAVTVSPMVSSQADVVASLVASSVKELTALIASGQYDSILDQIREAEVVGKNRVGVLKAIDSRKS